MSLLILFSQRAPFIPAFTTLLKPEAVAMLSKPQAVGVVTKPKALAEVVEPRTEPLH